MFSNLVEGTIAARQGARESKRGQERANGIWDVRTCKKLVHRGCHKTLEQGSPRNQNCLDNFLCKKRDKKIRFDS